VCEAGQVTWIGHTAGGLVRKMVQKENNKPPNCSTGPQIQTSGRDLKATRTCSKTRPCWLTNWVKQKQRRIIRFGVFTGQEIWGKFQRERRIKRARPGLNKKHFLQNQGGSLHSPSRRGGNGKLFEGVKTGSGKSNGMAMRGYIASTHERKKEENLEREG